MLKGVLRKKIWSDIIDNWGRTLQAVLIIAIGSVAIGSIMGSTELIEQDITNGWLQQNPASIGLSLGGGGVSKELVDTMGKYPEIDQIEGQFSTGINWRRSPNDPWEPATLIAREDYQDMKLFELFLEDGDWPRNKIMTANLGYGVETGERILIDVNDKVRVINIGGITWYLNTNPPKFGGNPTFFTTKENFQDITGVKKYNYITASVPGAYTEAKAKKAAMRLEAKIEDQNVSVNPGTAEGNKTIDPKRHPAQDPVNGIFFILQIMAFAALILGLFLVYNTITAIISQQVPQIGVLKAIGATQGQILQVYYSTVLVYGLLAVIISIPLGALGAHGLRVFMVDFIGMVPGEFGISTTAILVQIAICIFSPLLIATLPIMRGAGITVREAISTYGLSGGGGVIDWLMARLAFIPRMTSMAFSNTFRNKTRVFMTQITLVGAGVLFMAVMSAQSSIVYTFGPVLLDVLRADIFYGLDKKERFEPVTRLTQETEPASREIEMWASVRTKNRPAGEAEGFDDRLVTITGLPIPSLIYGHQLRGGRWLQPDDTYALVMHQKEAAKLGVGVGDWVTLDIPLKRESDWQVVGLLNDPLEPARIVAPRDTILQEERKVGRGNNLFITTTYVEPQQNVQSAARLRSTLYQRGYDVSANEADTVKGLGAVAIQQMSIIIYLLLIMAVLIAIIGGIALSGVLSINVLERRVEIGILRAIGASNRSIGSLFITEGVLLGWLSWLIAVPISIPFSTLLIAAIGSAIEFEFGFEYSVTSVWIWLIVITVIGIGASWLPARGAVRVSVRESLSYE